MSKSKKKGKQKAERLAQLERYVRHNYEELLEAVNEKKVSFTNEELDTLADGVAERIAGKIHWHQDETRKDRIKRLASNLAQNLAASAMWQLLLYSLAQVLLLDSATERETSDEEKTHQKVRFLYYQRLSYERRKDLDALNYTLTRWNWEDEVLSPTEIDAFCEIKREVGYSSDKDIMAGELRREVIWALRHASYAKMLSEEAEVVHS